MDKISYERIELLHPIVREEAKQILAEIESRLTGKSKCRFTFTLRTFAEQDALYAKGRTTPGPVVTKAKGGQSWHNYGLAIDCGLLIDTDGNGTFETLTGDIFKDYDADGVKDWEEIVFVFKMHGWEWGGDWANFKDYPHFQKTFGLTLAQALKSYTGGNVIAGTNYIKIGI